METKTQKSVYLAGPMRGIPAFNYPAFNATAKALRAQGWTVVNPAEIGNAYGPPEDLAADATLLERLMRHELATICKCDAIALMRGWENSAGAQRELAVALAVGLKVLVL